MAYTQLMGPIFLFSTSIPAQYGEDYLPSAKSELFDKTGPRVVIISSPSAASEDFFYFFSRPPLLHHKIKLFIICLWERIAKVCMAD